MYWFGIRGYKINKVDVPDIPANPVPLLTNPTVWLGYPFKKPRNVASPIPPAIPIKQLAHIAKANQNIGGSVSSGLGVLKLAVEIRVNEVIMSMLTTVILVICGTLTKHVPLANFVIKEKDVIAN